MVRNAAVFALVAMCAIAAPLAAQHATEAEPNDNASTATLVQLGDTISGTVAYNNLDYFAVDLAAGTKLQLVILDGQFCHGFMLVDRDGQKGLREDDCFHETGLRDTINYQVPTAGRYYFSIWHQDETPSDGERPPIPYRMRAAAYKPPRPGPGNPLHRFASGVDGIGAWVATPRGNLIVSHNNRLDWMSPDGHVSRFADGGGAQLAVDAFGDLLVAAGSNGVQRYSLETGERSQFAPPPGSGLGYSGIAIGADGDVWVSQPGNPASILTRYDALGNLKDKIVVAGLWVESLAMSQQGQLFFVAGFKNDVYRLVDNLTPQRVIQAPESPSVEFGFGGVLLDRDGWLYALQPIQQRMLLYNAQYQLAREPLAWINDSTGWKRLHVTGPVWMRDGDGNMTDRMLVGRLPAENDNGGPVDVVELNHSGMGAPGADPMLHVTQKKLRDGSAGSSYADTLHLQQGSSSKWTVVSGDLPEGLSLSSDGVISGTPTDKGDAKFVVRAADGARAGFGRFTVTIGSATALEVDATALSPATVGKSYADTLHVTNASGAVTWAISDGALPKGIALDASSGVLSGTPTDAGSFKFTASATASGRSGSASFTIAVAAAGVAAMQINRSPLRTGVLGAAYADTMHVANASGDVTWAVTTGRLPPGISLTSTSGVVAGLATDTGSFAFTVKATSGAQTASAQFTILVTPIPIATDDIVNALFGDKTLGAEIVEFLDVHGNHNGRLDVGDLRAFLRARGVVHP